jgi:MFS family permease
MVRLLQEFRSFSLPARRYLVMHMLGAATMIAYCVYPVYLKELGITITGIGLLYTIADFAKIVLTYFTGRWLDRVGAKAGIALDWCVSGASILVYSVAGQFWHLVAGELVERVSGLFNPGFAAYENDAFEEEKREKIYAYHLALPYVVQMAVFPFLALLLSRWRPGVATYRMVYVGCGLGMILVSAHAFFRLPPVGGEAVARRTWLWYRIPRRLRMIVLVELVENLAFSCTPGFILAFLILEPFRGTVFDVVISHLMFGAAVVICSGFTKAAAGRLSNLLLATVGVLFFLGFDILVLAGKSLPVLYLAFLFAAWGWGIWFPQHQSMKMRLVPKGRRGEFHASVQAIRDLVCIPFPVGIALLAKHAGLKAPFALQIGLWGVMLGIYGWLALSARRETPLKPEPGQP